MRGRRSMKGSVIQLPDSASAVTGQSSTGPFPRMPTLVGWPSPGKLCSALVRAAMKLAQLILSLQLVDTSSSSLLWCLPVCELRPKLRAASRHRSRNPVNQSYLHLRLRLGIPLENKHPTLTLEPRHPYGFATEVKSIAASAVSFFHIHVCPSQTTSIPLTRWKLRNRLTWLSAQSP